MIIELKLTCARCGSDLKHWLVFSEDNDADNTAEHTLSVEPCETCKPSVPDNAEASL
jgi:hypothetical protein